MELKKFPNVAREVKRGEEGQSISARATPAWLK